MTFISNIKALVLALILVLLSSIAFSQGTIVSAVPSAAVQGQSSHVIIRASGTQFNESSTVDFGPGIEVISLNFQNIETIFAQVKVSSSANIGFRDVSVTTNGQAISLDDGFEVFDSGENIKAVLEVLPIEVLYLGDVDPGNIAGAPLVFNIMVYNDQSENDLRTELEVSSDRFGLIFTGRKVLGVQSPGVVTTFNNKEFDYYNITDASEEFIELSTRTGYFPADIYTFKINIYKGETIVASDEAISVIENPISDIELIFPGDLLDNPMNEISTPLPLFQWFSQANSFTFSLYLFESGQSTIEDALQNLPVYTTSDLVTNTFQYPNGAEALIEGATYVWRVEAMVNSTRGVQRIQSEGFVFKYTSTGHIPTEVSTIIITPLETEIQTSHSAQFEAQVLNSVGEIIEQPVTWKVVPSLAGVINESGFFMAGSRPIPCAVVASIGDLHEYANITLSFNSSSIKGWDLEPVIKAMFGISDEDKE